MKKFIFCAITIALMALVHFCGQTPQNESPAKAVDGSNKTTFELRIPILKFDTTRVPVMDTVVNVVAVQIRKQHVLRDTVVLKDTIRVPILDTVYKTVVQRDTVYVSDTIHVPVMDMATVTTGPKVDSIKVESVVDSVQKTPKPEIQQSQIKFTLDGSVGLAYSPDSVNRTIGSVGLAIVSRRGSLSVSWNQRGFNFKQFAYILNNHISIGLKDSNALWASPRRTCGTAGDYRNFMLLSKEGNMPGSLPSSIAAKVKGIDMRPLLIAGTQINYHQTFASGRAALEVSVHPLVKAARLGMRFNHGDLVASVGCTAAFPTQTYNVKGNLGIIKESWSLFTLNEAIIASKQVTARSMLHMSATATPKLKAQAWACVQYGTSAPSYSAGGDASYNLGKGYDIFVGALYRSDVNLAISGSHFMSKEQKYAIYMGVRFVLRN